MKICTLDGLRTIYENDKVASLNDLVNGALSDGIRNFSEADLIGYELYDMLFDNCDFSKASFDKASLNKSRFISCHMTGASFRGSGVSSALFSQCDLQDSIFEKTHMGYCAIEGCLTRGSNLVDLGMTEQGYRVVMTYENGQAIIRAGCREMHLDDARLYYPESNNDEKSARITLARRIAHQRGWLHEVKATGIEIKTAKAKHATDELTEECPVETEVSEAVNA